MKSLQKIIPPVYLLLSLLLMGVLHRFLPLMQIVSAPLSYTGILVMIAGVALLVSCHTLFTRAETPIVPFQTSTRLLTHGIYRYSRNPIYLAMLTVLLGLAITLGSLTPFLVLPVFFFIIQEAYVKHEEPFLENIFGEEYRKYKSQVRRWL